MTSSVDPYSTFNFLLEWSHQETGDTGKAGFQEVTGLGSDITVSKYREGGSNWFHKQQVTGVNKFTNITLKRGLMIAGGLYEWTECMRQGSGQACRNAIITMRNDMGQVIIKWKLTGAFPTKYTGSTFNAKGNDVAIEELVLSVAGIDVETNGTS